MKIALAQLDPVVGDITGNLNKAISVMVDVGDEADMIVFPELYITGYPPRDLLEKPHFMGRVDEATDRLIEETGKSGRAAILMGLPTASGIGTGIGLYNSAVLISDGGIVGTANKSLLPSYDVFDETRYFDPSPSVDIIPFRGEMLGVSICEDMWTDNTLWRERPYAVDPVRDLCSAGATVLINLSASPFTSEKEGVRWSLVSGHARSCGVPFVFVNQVGGNDELVFDGRSMGVDAGGEAIAVLSSFREDVKIIDTSSAGNPENYKAREKLPSVKEALVLGVKDYVGKCGFSKAVVGLSGGIDSSLVACIAAEAIGPENVLGITMPSRYSASESAEYSKALAENLGIEFRNIPIADIYGSYLDQLCDELGADPDREVGVDLQNIQARIRGNILMAFSNRFGHLLLTTGNKSEMAVGYCTLYGDMAGGLAVISDIPKTMVYELSEHVNRDREIIPRGIIERVPSAELRPDQADQDTLPPYDILDGILYQYLEQRASVADILKMGYDEDAVKWTVRAVRLNEYKRKQAPPGLKVTSKAFGVGRRMPIAARYED